MKRIGFMQGRLCDQVGELIQAFPWDEWEQEFPRAKSIGIQLMEWTLDSENLPNSPLMTAQGREKIKRLCVKNGLSIPSLTGDCFMQAPFWKRQGSERTMLQSDFLAIANACSISGISLIVVPLVDSGAICSAAEEDLIVAFLTGHLSFFFERGLRIAFECDFPPAKLARLINRFPIDTFGVNYDIGNSASLGYDPREEFRHYGKRILNVHVKDRPIEGTTVPLGSGAADFSTVFRELARVEYKGNYILQTARAQIGRHSEAIHKYASMTQGWIDEFGA